MWQVSKRALEIAVIAGYTLADGLPLGASTGSWKQVRF